MLSKKRRGGASSGSSTTTKVDTPDAVCAGVKKTVALGDLTQRASRDHAPTTLRCDPSPASPSVKNVSSRARTSGVSTRLAV